MLQNKENNVWKPLLKDFGRWLNRLHWKTTWRNYINGDMSYWEFKQKCFYTVNAVRKAVGCKYFSYNTFDEAWQYRVLGHENYTIAYDEMLNVLAGWW